MHTVGMGRPQLMLGKMGATLQRWSGHVPDVLLVAHLDAGKNEEIVAKDAKTFEACGVEGMGR